MILDQSLTARKPMELVRSVSKRLKKKGGETYFQQFAKKEMCLHLAISLPGQTLQTILKGCHIQFGTHGRVYHKSLQVPTDRRQCQSQQSTSAVKKSNGLLDALEFNVNAPPFIDSVDQLLGNDIIRRMYWPVVSTDSDSVE
ncbi:hypothetical protein TNCV_1900971 [Trichonephila clavipes]|nr:hypothetical protein TNCV_1900971 [Trichonephila clavipes]